MPYFLSKGYLGDVPRNFVRQEATLLDHGVYGKHFHLGFGLTSIPIFITSNGELTIELINISGPRSGIDISGIMCQKNRFMLENLHPGLVSLTWVPKNRCSPALIGHTTHDNTVIWLEWFSTEPEISIFGG